MKENVLVSACLIGVVCRYDGKSKPCDAVLTLIGKANLIPICPEIMGGLPTPRVPSEIIGDRVVNAIGTDVTAEYNRGADEALRLAKLYGCKYALLKAKSPSCGKCRIYDGTFTKSLTDGDGITVRRLTEAGIAVFTEDEIASLEALL